MEKLILTDTPTTLLPLDGSCPQCRAGDDRRVSLGLDGRRQACGQCGFEFPVEGDRG